MENDMSSGWMQKGHVLFYSDFWINSKPLTMLQISSGSNNIWDYELYTFDF